MVKEAEGLVQRQAYCSAEWAAFMPNAPLYDEVMTYRATFTQYDI